jgi:hypothetical protein
MKIIFFILIIQVIGLEKQMMVYQNKPPPIIIQDRFAMLINKYCNETIFIEISTDLQKDNLNNIVDNIKSFELVNSYSFITNYSGDLDKTTTKKVSSENYICDTDYNLKENYNIKKTQVVNNNYFENFIFLLFVFIFPLYFIATIFYCSFRKYCC